jgi:hypothetical protein
VSTLSPLLLIDVEFRIRGPGWVQGIYIVEYIMEQVAQYLDVNPEIIKVFNSIPQSLGDAECNYTAEDQFLSKRSNDAL